ncbi:MAG TPA: hypothetical protein VIM52_15885 [Stellaceae bacterium]
MSLITATLGRIAAPERRTMGVACGAHVLHDGYTDLLYVLLPLWQAEFLPRPSRRRFAPPQDEISF